MIDRAHLLASIGPVLFNGSVSPRQEKGILCILDAWERLAPAADLRWIAYSLATTFHETARRFTPLAEFGKGAGKKYGKPDPETGQVFYGRGYVQLTHKANYQKMGWKLGFDFVNNPDKVMEPNIAAEILIRGMIDGDFTGKALVHYISGAKCDYVGARRIVNGLDRAQLIADYAEKFEAALRLLKKPSPPLVSESPAAVLVPAPVVVAETPKPAPAPSLGLWASIKQWLRSWA